MELVLIIAGLAGALGLFTWGYNSVRRSWVDAASRLGLVMDGSALDISGIIDDCVVKITSTFPSRSSHTEIVLRPEPPLPAGLALGPEGVFQTVVKTVTGRDVEIGDEAFDDKVVVQGDPAMLCAVLDPANRRLISKAVGEGLVVDGGEVRIRLWKTVTDAAELESLVRRALAVRRRLRVEPREVPKALVERVRRDPLPDVRQRAFDLLFERYPDRPETQAALGIALEDVDPALRLDAASRAGDDGFDAFRRLVLGQRVPIDVRQEAFDRLVRRFPPARSAPIIVDALQGPMQVAAARQLARSGRDTAIDPLLAALPEATDAVAAALFDALGQLARGVNPKIEAAMLDALARPDTATRPRARVAACEGLAVVGQTGALEHLLPLTEGLTLSSALKQAARRAVAAIRERRGDGPVGALTVVESDRAGELAIAQAAPAGATSVAEGAADGLDRARARAEASEPRFGAQRDAEESR